MNILETINDLGKKAKAASIKIRVLNPENKKIAYDFLEKNIKNKSNVILDANKLDIENAIKNNLSKPLINRLKINEESILGIIKSINQIKNQPDPIGEILENWRSQFPRSPNKRRLDKSFPIWMQKSPN